MKSISENLFRRGKSNICYLRRRIPTALLAAYPAGKTEIVLSLRTSDIAKANKRFHIEQVRLDAGFSGQLQRVTVGRQFPERAGCAEMSKKLRVINVLINIKHSYSFVSGV